MLQPYFPDYNGPSTVGLECPALPKNLAQLDPTAQKEANSLYLKKSLCVLYKTLVHRRNPRLYRAMAFQEISSFDLLLIARTLLVSVEATYLAHIVELETTWAELSGIYARGGAPFPFRFCNKEEADIEADVNRALRGMEAMRGVKESIGELFPERGIVRNDLYDEAPNALQQMKEQVIDTYARDEKEEIWREGWPSDN